jgi:hypothetical protein
MDLGEVGWDRDRWWALVSTAIKLCVPLKAGNFLTVGSSRRTLLYGVAQLFQESSQHMIFLIL